MHNEPEFEGQAEIVESWVEEVVRRVMAEERAGWAPPDWAPLGTVMVVAFAVGVLVGAVLAS